MNEWLADLKVGDRVVIANNWYENLSKVTKLTPTLIVCGPSRFRKATGYGLGGTSWDRARLVKPAQEILDRIEERQLREKIGNAIKDKATTLAALRAMHAAYKDGIA